MDTTVYPLYTVSVVLPLLSAITVVLDIPPLIWHFSQRNVAATSLIFWIIVLNIFNIINALIWPRDNVQEWWNGNGLCDIEVRIFIGSAVALPGALVCIVRKLAKVMDTKNIVLAPSRSHRIKENVFEVLWCFGFPLLFMLVYYVVQPIRYFVWGVSGCNPAFDSTWPTVALYAIWPPILSIVGVYYAVLLTWRLHRYRSEFSRLITAKSTTKSRFLRLLIMSLIMIIGVLPVQIYILYRNVEFVEGPYSWTEVHGPHWSSIITIPSYGTVVFDRWARLAYGFIVFLTFGMGKDASTLYRTMFIGVGFGVIWPSLYKTESPDSDTTLKQSWFSMSRKTKNMFMKKNSGTSSTTNSTPQADSYILQPHSTMEYVLPPSSTHTCVAQPESRFSFFKRCFSNPRSPNYVLPLFSLSSKKTSVDEVQHSEPRPSFTSDTPIVLASV